MHNLLAAIFHRQPKEPASPSTLQLFLPSCISILLSTSCFMAATWGWFTANQSCSATTITAGSWNAKSASVITTTVDVYTTEYRLRPAAESTAEPQAPASGDVTSSGSTEASAASGMALSHATDAASVKAFSLEAQDLSGDTKDSAEGETQSETMTPSPSPEPPAEPQTILLKTESETVITYSDPVDLPRNEDNDFCFEATANQNHHFIVETEGTASGYVQVTIEEISAGSGEDDSSSWETENCTLYAFVDGDGIVEFNLLLSVPCMVTIHTSWGFPEEEALEQDNFDIIPTDSVFTQRSTFLLSSELDEVPDMESDAETEIPTYGYGVQEEILHYEVIVESPVQPEAPSTTETPSNDNQSPIIQNPSTETDPPSSENTPIIEALPADEKAPSDEDPIPNQESTSDEESTSIQGSATGEDT